jgi:hypothetical protein
MESTPAIYISFYNYCFFIFTSFQEDLSGIDALANTWKRYN